SPKPPPNATPKPPSHSSQPRKSRRKRKIRTLAMANASICKALESGTRFRRTRDTGLYADIKKRLEASADYYREAGFKNAADWTRATQRMFDGLVYLTDAEIERDPKKKQTSTTCLKDTFNSPPGSTETQDSKPRKMKPLGHLDRIREE